MAKKKKNTVSGDSEQTILLDGSNITEFNRKDNDEIKSLNKGELLEYQIKRLFFLMGYFPKTNIIIQTSSDDPTDIVTDLDVYGIYVHSDFTLKTIWSDCKSGETQEINRVVWLAGIKEMIKVDDVLFVKKGTKLSTKLFASSKGIQIVDLSTIEDMEERFGIENSDWRGSWNPIVQKDNKDTFKSISTPNNTICKRILKFISTHYWAIEDNFTKCKKTITALRDLATLVELPLSSLEKKSIRWAVYQLCTMLVFPLLQICRQVQYFPNKDKIELVNLGLVYGSNPKSKIDDILKVTNNIAKKTLLRYCGDKGDLVDLPEIKLNAPEYAEAFINIIFRIIERPLNYFDILRFMDFTLMQYDLNEQKYDYTELNDIFGNVEELLKSSKTVLHFICHITNMPQEIFILLNEKNN